MNQDVYTKHPLDHNAPPAAYDRTAVPHQFRSACWMGTVQGSGYCAGMDGVLFYDGPGCRTRLEAMGGWMITDYGRGIAIQNYVPGRAPKASLQQEPLLPFAPPSDATYVGRQKIEHYDNCEKYTFLYNDEPAEIWMLPPCGSSSLALPVLLRHIKPSGDVIFFLKDHDTTPVKASLFDIQQYIPADSPATVNVRGFVRDEHTREPLVSVSICARRQDNGEMDWTVVNGASSRADGSFSLHLTPGLSFILTCARPKQQPVMRSIDVPATDVHDFEILLSASAPAPSMGGPTLQSSGSASAFNNPGAPYTQAQYGATTATYYGNTATYATPNASVQIAMAPGQAAQLAAATAMAASMGYGGAYGSPYGAPAANMTQLAQAQAVAAQYAAYGNAAAPQQYPPPQQQQQPAPQQYPPPQQQQQQQQPAASSGLVKGWMEKFSMGRRAMVGGINFGALFSSFNWKRRFFTLYPDGRLGYGEHEAYAALDYVKLSRDSTRLVTRPTSVSHTSVAGVQCALVIIFFDNSKEFRLPLKCANAQEHSMWCQALAPYVAQVDAATDL